MGMALTDIEYKDEQRKNHHLYAAKPIKEFFDKYMQRFSEKRRLINKWNKKIGNIIQKKVAENCISVLRENNIDFEINNLLAQDEEDPFAKENVLLMRKVLNELLYENTCNLPCTNK